MRNKEDLRQITIEAFENANSILGAKASLKFYYGLTPEEYIFCFAILDKAIEMHRMNKLATANEFLRECGFDLEVLR